MGKASRLAALVACLLLAGCAAQDAFTPTSATAAGMPYANLDENSYGPRSTTRLQACDADSGKRRFAGVAAVASRPVQGLLKIDATLQSLDLARHFTDPLGRDHPPVAVLSHSADSIVFWHSLRDVPLAEVTTAATAYCSSRQLGVLYRGSASRCPPPQIGLSGATVVQTDVVSAYACTGRR